MPRGGKRENSGRPNRLTEEQSEIIGFYCQRRFLQLVNANTKRRVRIAREQTNILTNQAWLEDLPFNDDPLKIGKNSRELMHMVVKGQIDDENVPERIVRAAELLLDIRDERANTQVYYTPVRPYNKRSKIIAIASLIFSKRFGFHVRESTIEGAWFKFRKDKEKDYDIDIPNVL